MDRYRRFLGLIRFSEKSTSEKQNGSHFKFSCSSGEGAGQNSGNLLPIRAVKHLCTLTVGIVTPH